MNRMGLSLLECVFRMTALGHDVEAEISGQQVLGIARSKIVMMNLRSEP
jgi:hypothetical protein